MFSHLTGLIGLRHASIILIVAELLSNLTVHQVSELVSFGLGHELKAEICLPYATKRLRCFSKLFVESIVLLLLLLQTLCL